MNETPPSGEAQRVAPAAVDYFHPFGYNWSAEWERSRSAAGFRLFERGGFGKTGLENVVVVVIGAGRSLGRATAGAFAAEGSRLALADVGVSTRRVVSGLREKYRNDGVETWKGEERKPGNRDGNSFAVYSRAQGTPVEYDVAKTTGKAPGVCRSCGLPGL